MTLNSSHHCQLSAVKDSLPNHISVNLKATKVEVKKSVLNVLNININFRLIYLKGINSFSHKYWKLDFMIVLS